MVENCTRKQPARSLTRGMGKFEGRFDPCCSPDELRQTLGYFGNVGEGVYSIFGRALNIKISSRIILILTFVNNAICANFRGEKLTVLPRPSPCGRFHISSDGERTHNSDFDWVLPFHKPGLALLETLQVLTIFVLMEIQHTAFDLSEHLVSIAILQQ